VMHLPDKRIVVTGGAGFIGSALVRRIIGQTQHEALVYDKLTYAANLASLQTAMGDARFSFVRADICDPAAVCAALDRFRPLWVMNLAAESHVDRSIDGPAAFIQTNVVGTSVLLQACLDYWRRLDQAERPSPLQESIGRTEPAGKGKGEDEPGALLFESISDQHCGHGHQAEKRELVHRSAFSSFFGSGLRRLRAEWIG